MEFILTLLYIAITILSPDAIWSELSAWRINLIIGILTIATGAFNLHRTKLTSMPVTYLGLGLLFAAPFSILATGWIGGSIAPILSFLPAVMAFYFVAVTCVTMRRLKILIWVLLCVAVFILVKGAIARMTGDLSSPYILVEGAGDRINSFGLFRQRGMGILADPNDLAQFLVMLMPLLFLTWKKGQTVRNTFLTLLPCAFLVVGIYYTHSRGGVFALIAVLFWGFKEKLGVIGSSIAAAMGFLAMLALNVGGGRGMDQDDGTRVTFWAKGLQELKFHPLFGIGYGNFGDLTRGRTAHNSYVLCVVELGVFGYFFWMGMLVASWTGLSAVLRIRAQSLKEGGSKALRRLRTGAVTAMSAPPISSLVGSAAGPTLVGSAPGAGNMTARVSQTGTVAAYVPRGPASQLTLPKRPMDVDFIDIDDLARTAKAVQTSMVGMLMAAMFLSRTYEVTMYITLGIAAVVVSHSPKPAALPIRPLLLRIFATVFLSILAIYLFVRLHGGK